MLLKLAFLNMKKAFAPVNVNMMLDMRMKMSAFFECAIFHTCFEIYIWKREKGVWMGVCTCTTIMGMVQNQDHDGVQDTQMATEHVWSCGAQLINAGR